MPAAAPAGDRQCRGRCGRPRGRRPCRDQIEAAFNAVGQPIALELVDGGGLARMRSSATPRLRASRSGAATARSTRPPRSPADSGASWRSSRSARATISRASWRFRPIWKKRPSWPPAAPCAGRPGSRRATGCSSTTFRSGLTSSWSARREASALCRSFSRPFPPRGEPCASCARAVRPDARWRERLVTHAAAVHRQQSLRSGRGPPG